MSFTRKEEALIRTPYFEVIRETEQFIEVMSLNTNHCWNIFKHTFESGKHITLYHKHKLSDPYYHEHRNCRTVAAAVEEIMSHDEYVLNKRNNIAKADVAERHLKVYEGSDKDYKPVSQIRLQGKWLESLGFEPGTPFTVKCEAGKLTLIAE